MNILCMGETLLRYSTEKGHRFSDLDFAVHIGGSETNIAVSLAQFGFDTKMLTKLPENAIGDAVIAFMRKYGVDTSPILRNNMRMGAYFLESGSGNRTSQVADKLQLISLFQHESVKLGNTPAADTDVDIHQVVTEPLGSDLLNGLIPDHSTQFVEGFHVLLGKEGCGCGVIHHSDQDLHGFFAHNLVLLFNS